MKSLEEKVEVGEYKPYLSKRTLRLSNDDKLLSHWEYIILFREIWDRNDFQNVVVLFYLYIFVIIQRFY